MTGDQVAIIRGPGAHKGGQISPPLNVHERVHGQLQSARLDPDVAGLAVMTGCRSMTWLDGLT